jgi:hypothetical protein
VDDEASRTKFEAFGRSLYAAHGKRLGWNEAAGDDGETRLFRAAVLSFLALDVEEPTFRREAEKRGRAYLGVDGDRVLHPEVLGNDLVGIALTVAVQEGDAALFAHVAALLDTTTDAVLRERLLAALGATRDATLAVRALSLSLDPTVRVNEALTPLARQLGDRERRDDAWMWLVANFDALLSRVGPARGGRLPWLGAVFCSSAGAERVRALFEPQQDRLSGGPRNLQGALEAVGLCAAKVSAQRAGAASFLIAKRR